MSLCLVLHDVPADGGAAAEAFSQALFHITPEHWPLTPGAVLLASGVSPTYLREHLLRELRLAGVEPGMLLVGSVAPDLVWHGLPPEGQAWLREHLD